ncbi:hypothetical protein [Bartonella sp. ML70XJBT.G]|uniref:hypothetical protein n=1 Tax=Bartonella sp. ML70XJBT.G TaxID=3019093 RepID=UPI00235DC7C0|nr:hypothetical protein [Bartonella sp. ML70XJBT.G]
MSLARLPVPPHPHAVIKNRSVHYPSALYEEGQIRQQQIFCFCTIGMIFVS